MKKMLLVAFTGASLAVCAAKPTISNFAVTDDATLRTVTATYDLDVTAVVTALVEYNDAGTWKPLAGANSIAGANHKVAAGTGRKVVWALGKDFPGTAYDAGKLRLTLKAWDLEMPPNWMVVDPTCSNQAYYACKEMIPGGIADSRYKSRYMVFRKIPAKGVVFRMGSSEAERTIGVYVDGGANEALHLVTFSSDWYMAIYECTQAQWMKVANTTTNPSKWAQDSASNTTDCPVEYVSYKTITGTFFSALVSRTGIEFGLPTEAQWEYSCRAGYGTALYDGNNLGANRDYNANLNKIAWNKGNSEVSKVVQPHPVGLLNPNKFDLYDMLGNVREYTRDVWNESYGLTAQQIADSATTPIEDPYVASASSTVHVKRGGVYQYNIENARAGKRYAANDNAEADRGFRVWAPAIVK